ncbi:MAG: hypothetical protein HQL52_04300 [Magnetococcales bacterium]|nr:hypothetical protein [Magnetococcales bacterium]
MSGNRELYLSEVIQKTFLEVNEKGTEAAAATAMLILAGCLPEEAPPPIPQFRADHPFLFLIRERRYGQILFMGRVADPTSGG